MLLSQNDVMLEYLKPTETLDAGASLNSKRGVHILADFYDCSSNNPLFTNASMLEDKCRNAVYAVGLNELRYIFHKFPDSGVTGVILLSESHFAIHTWPEKNYLTLDIFVCNLFSDNTGKAKSLYITLEALFQPKRVSHREIIRD